MRFLIKRRKKIIYKIIKNILYSKDINFHCIYDIDNNLIKFNIKKNKKYHIII